MYSKYIFRSNNSKCVYIKLNQIKLNYIKLNNYFLFFVNHVLDIFCHTYFDIFLALYTYTSKINSVLL